MSAFKFIYKLVAGVDSEGNVSIFPRGRRQLFESLDGKLSVIKQIFDYVLAKAWHVNTIFYLNINSVATASSFRSKNKRNAINTL